HFAIKAFVDALADERTRVSAADALCELGHAAVEAVPALIQTLGHKSWNVRSSAADALESIGTPAVPFLVQALRDQTAAVRLSITMILGSAAATAGAAVPQLVEALNDKSDNVRRSAADALGTIGPAAI